MKKQYFALVTVGIAACCLGACKSKHDEYDALNAMLHANYSQMSITVTDTFDENTSLKSIYLVTYLGDFAIVDYSIEQFAELSLDGPTSSSAKTTRTGKATIEYDTVRIEGDSVDIDFYSIAHPKLTFAKANFINVLLSDVYLIADVEDPSAFLGAEIDCSNMTVTAMFRDVFDNIQINYTSEGGNEVNYTYIFTA